MEETQDARGTVLSCSLCGCHFKRTEHLSRHMLSHRGSKPHVCQTCGKAFTRRDTLVRHLPVHAVSNRSSRRSAARASRACVQCARSRLRCDGHLPCARCSSNGYECTAAGPARNCIAVVDDLPGAAATSIPIVHDTIDNPTSADIELNGTGNVSVALTQTGSMRELVTSHDLPSAAFQYSAESDYHMPNMFDPTWPWVHDFNALDWISFEPTIPLLHDENILRPARWSEIGPGTEAAAVASPTQQRAIEKPPLSPESEASKTAQTCEWPTDWDPVKTDKILAFPDADSIPLDVLEAENFAHVEGLSQIVYAEIERALQKATSGQVNFKGGQIRLPPIEALDCFVQLYFEHFHPSFPMLHKPTFNPAKAPWQLVLATAAIGCRFSRAPSSGQWADAFQELLGRCIGDTIDADNTIVRELWVSQAIQLNYFGMTYNGNKRHLEAAEFYRNGLATYSRRMGAIRRSPRQKQPVFSANMSAGYLEQQWMNWIEEESLRRLGFCCFLRDAQAGLYFDFHPSMAVKELQHPLPCHEELWEASTCLRWRELFMLIPENEHALTINAAVAIIHCEDHLRHRIGDFARLVLVCATYQTIASVQNIAENPLLSHCNGNLIPNDAFSSLATDTLQAVSPFHSQSRASTPLKDSVTLHILLVLMLLHAPRQLLLNHAHTFNTDQELSGTRDEVAEWMAADEGRTARRAVAYAGQLLGAINTCKLKGAHEPIMLLLCTVTLWTYSSMTEPKSPNPTRMTCPTDKIRRDRGTIVRLDDLDCDAEEWINGQTLYPAHIKDVGNICRPGAAVQILETGINTLKELGPWGISQGLGLWMMKLKLRSQVPGN